MMSTTSPSVFCWKYWISVENGRTAVVVLEGAKDGIRMKPMVVGPDENVPERNKSVLAPPRRSLNPAGGLKTGKRPSNGPRPLLLIASAEAARMLPSATRGAI